MTVAGTARTAGFELVNVTTVPDGPPGALSATDADEYDRLLVTVPSQFENPLGAGGFTVIVAVTALPLYVAVMCTVTGALTQRVVTLNAGDKPAAAGTVTVGGTDTTDVLLLARLITAPPAGAAPSS